MAHCFDVITVQVLFSLACIFLVNPSSRTSCALWWNPHYWETWLKNWFNESDVRLVPLKFLVSCTIVCLPFSVRFPRNVDCFFWFSLLSVLAELSIIENIWARFGNLIRILFYFVRLWVLHSSKGLWVNRFSGSLLRHVITIQVLFPIGLQPFPQFFTDLLLFVLCDHIYILRDVIENWFNESDVRLLPLKFLVSCTIVCLTFSERLLRSVDSMSSFLMLSVLPEFLTILKLTRLNLESWFVNGVDICGC